MGSLYFVSSTGLIATAAGINLPTIGGTPTALNYNEEKVAVTFTLTGPWAANRSFPVTFTRTGKFVIMEWADLSATAGTVLAAISSTGGIVVPPRFVPSNVPFTAPINVYVGSAINTGVFKVLLAGSYVLNFTNTGNSSFPTGQNIGIPGGSAIWGVD